MKEKLDSENLEASLEKTPLKDRASQFTEEKILKNKEFQVKFGEFKDSIGGIDKGSQEFLKGKMGIVAGIFDQIEGFVSKTKQSLSKEDREKINKLQKDYGGAILKIRETLPGLNKFSNWYGKQPGWAKEEFKLINPLGHVLRFFESFGFIDSNNESKKYAQEMGLVYKEDISEKTLRKYSAKIIGAVFEIPGFDKFVEKGDKLSEEVLGVLQNGVAMARAEREKEIKG